MWSNSSGALSHTSNMSMDETAAIAVCVVREMARH